MSQELEKKRSGRPDQAKQENQYQGKKHNHLLELKDKKPRLFELKEQNQTQLQFRSEKAKPNPVIK